MKTIPIINNYLDKERLEFINQLLLSNQTPTSKLISLLEARFGSNVLLVNSYASSLHLALCALDLKRGDKVLMSVNSLPYAATSVRYFDAEPIFIDCDVNSFNISADALHEALKKHTHKKLKALFLHHHSGNCAEVSKIAELCDEYKITLIHDAKTALSLSEDGNLVAKSAKISCFSFYESSLMPANQAAFMVINDEALLKRAKLLANMGVDKLNDKDLSYFYDVMDLGHDYALCELSAAAAVYELMHYDEFLVRRKQIAQIYSKEFANLKHINRPFFSEFSTYNDYIIKVDKNRDSFARGLKDAGILTNICYIPMNLLSYFKQKYSLKITDFPNALAAYAQVLSLPIYASLSDDEVGYICKEVIKLDSQWV